MTALAVRTCDMMRLKQGDDVPRCTWLKGPPAHGGRRTETGQVTIKRLSNSRQEKLVVCPRVMVLGMQRRVETPAVFGGGGIGTRHTRASISHNF